MEPSSPTQTAQEQPRILHPDLEEIAKPEPEAYLIDSSAQGQRLPTFDYEAALRMVQPQASTSPEQLKGPEEEPKFFPRTNVLRPGDDVRRTNIEKIKAALAVGVFGIAGAVATGEAEAGGINTKPFEQETKLAIKNAVLGAVLPNAAIKRDQNGNEVLVRKSPQEIAINLPPQYVNKPGQPTVLEYAKAIGLDVINDGMLFSIVNENNPAQKVSIKKYYSPIHYTTSIRVSQAPSGGIILSVQFIQDNIPKAELILINTDVKGNMGATKIGG